LTNMEPNSLLREEPARDGEGNRKWLARLGDADGIILIGGTSLTDFRVRVAQSSLRRDLLPSFWSLCGILLQGGVFASVPLNLRREISEIPPCNGVRMCPLDEFDDATKFPNVAVIRFAKEHKDVHDDIKRVQSDRNLIDLPSLLLPWLGFAWGTSGFGNPLSKGIGLPSAAFVETVFAMSGFELTPGLSSASSCPEAMWQAAKWWADFYKNIIGPTSSEATQSADAVVMVPQGFYTIRQRAAAIVEVH
jgi:hypothetical protein